MRRLRILSARYYATTQLTRLSPDLLRATCLRNWPTVGVLAFHCPERAVRGITHLSLTNSGNLLSFRAKLTPRSRTGVVYIFLLVASRADMDSQQRKLEGLDPTQVFERLCADILLNFWGGETEYSGSLVFGTARKKSGHNHRFESNIEHLCLMLHHGAGLKAKAKLPGAGDGKLDVVSLESILGRKERRPYRFRPVQDWRSLERPFDQAQACGVLPAIFPAAPNH